MLVIIRKFLATVQRNSCASGAEECYCVKSVDLGGLNSPLASRIKLARIMNS